MMGMASTNKPLAAGRINVIVRRKPSPSVSLKAREAAAVICADWREIVGRMAMLMADATKPWGNCTSVVAQFM